MIVRSNLLEMVEHMFRAIGRPKGQEVVVIIQQRAAAAHGDESGVALRLKCYTRAGRGTRGSKDHLVVDQQGVPLAVALSAANVHDLRPLRLVRDAAGVRAVPYFGTYLARPRSWASGIGRVPVPAGGKAGTGMADESLRVGPEQEEGVWRIIEGTAERRPREGPFRADGTERLTYNNPFGLEVERVWFDGRIVFAVEQGELDVDLSRVKVAQEYQVVYAVELDERGKLKPGTEPERVPGQYNIYDSVPGMERYSPLWQFNFVVVPRDYEANRLRSEADCLRSGYPILKSTIVEN
jgi:hypothetical protein